MLDCHIHVISRVQHSPAAPTESGAEMTPTNSRTAIFSFEYNAAPPEKLSIVHRPPTLPYPVMPAVAAGLQ